MNNAQQLGDTLGVSVLGETENRKNCLVRNNIEYVAVVDHDGDHLANELPNFVRAAEHILSQTGNDRIVVNECRTSRHRHLSLDIVQLVADQIIRPARRLEIPGAAGRRGTQRDLSTSDGGAGSGRRTPAARE